MGRKVKGKHINIYAPVGFKATWDLYVEICERDKVSASREIRKFVEGQVARRKPGNPQPPLTAFFEGHPDVVTRAWSTTLKELIARAEHIGGELTYKYVLQVLRDQGLEGTMLVARAGSMCDALRAVGVPISY